MQNAPAELKENGIVDLAVVVNMNARSRPGELTYASFGTGSSSHLAGELFQVMTKTRLLHVPYKGSERDRWAKVVKDAGIKPE